MATNHEHGKGPVNPEVDFDKTDLGARGILMFFVALGLFAIVMHVAALGIWIGLNKFADKHDPAISPLASNKVTPRSEVLMNTANINIKKFPEPRLQNDDTGDMQRFLLKETSALTADPWQDAQGNVHLPVEQAMSVALTRLTARQGGTAPAERPGIGQEFTHSSLQVESPEPLTQSDKENEKTAPEQTSGAK
ncbi:MAG: hypothetical protein P4M01_13380 [Acidobacteriota bacterium]|nr:hypothetical protein [Acidobacteriota bacterium]